MTESEHKSDFKLTTDTPYLALMGKLWDVYCEDSGENWLRYNGTTLYFGHVLFHDKIIFAVITESEFIFI